MGNSKKWAPAALSFPISSSSVSRASVHKPWHLAPKNKLHVPPPPPRHCPEYGLFGSPSVSSATTRVGADRPRLGLSNREFASFSAAPVAVDPWETGVSASFVSVSLLGTVR